MSVKMFVGRAPRAVEVNGFRVLYVVPGHASQDTKVTFPGVPALSMDPEDLRDLAAVLMAVAEQGEIDEEYFS
jgi:hypothetical protein